MTSILIYFYNNFSVYEYIEITLQYVGINFKMCTGDDITISGDLMYTKLKKAHPKSG